MRQIFTSLALILVFVVAFLSFKNYHSSNKYDFDLESELSKNTSLKDFKGQKLIVYFGFSSCPDICPLTLALLSSVLEKFPQKPYLALISLDPQRDNNLSANNEWLRYFYPHSTSLLARELKDLEQITKNYGVIYEKIELKDSFMPYSIAHSNDIFLFDEKGKLFKIVKDLSYKNLTKVFEEFLKD